MKRCCRSSKQARQRVLSHGLRAPAPRRPDRAAHGILVNWQAREHPGVPVAVRRVVEVAQTAKGQLRIKGSAEAVASRGYPEWVEVDAAALKGTFKARPDRSQLPSTINESLVVELYSK